MIVKGALSPSQMEAGRRNYNIFNLINGFSYICLGEMVIILFAIRMGSPDFCIAILGSFIFLSNFCMPLGKMFMARTGAAKTISVCWILRNVSALLVATAPLLALLHPAAGIGVIMLGAFGFYACRSTGVVGTQPLMGELTTPENRGKFTSGNYRLFNIAGIIMLSLIIALMNVSRDTWVFEAIIVTGAIFGFISAWFIGRVDETEALRISAAKPIMDDVKTTLKSPMRLKQIMANCVVSSAITLTLPISMLALKRGYGISDSDALLFALVQFAGGILTSYITSLLAEETGPRPLAILFYCSTLALCILWIIGPDTFQWGYSIWPFALAGAAYLGTGIAMTQYFLTTVPNKERVGASLTIYVISGVTAGVVGSVFGGGLLKWLDTFGLIPMDMFRLYFLIVLAALLFGLLLLCKLEPKADWDVGEVLSLAFAPKDIVALFNLYSIKQVSDPQQEREDMDRLLEIRSGLSERAMLSYLDSPRLTMRIRALTALGEIPFSQNTVKAILRELEEGEHTTANAAAQIAGERGIKEAIPILRKSLDSEDYYLQAKAMLSLAQLRDEPSYRHIKDIFKCSSNPRTLTNGAAALAELGDDESFKLLLDKTVSPGLPTKVLYELIYSMASLEGHGDGIYQFLKLYSKDRTSSILQLAELCADPDAAKRLAMELETGSSNKDAMRSILASEFEKDKTPKGRIIAAFLKDSAMANVPQELLLCLLPLAKPS